MIAGRRTQTILETQMLKLRVLRSIGIIAASIALVAAKCGGGY
jgi:hypothetical protein